MHEYFIHTCTHTMVPGALKYIMQKLYIQTQPNTHTNPFFPLQAIMHDCMFEVSCWVCLKIYSYSNIQAVTQR